MIVQTSAKLLKRQLMSPQQSFSGLCSPGQSHLTLLTVPLKSKLPPSRETRLSSRERLKNTVSTKSCRSREIKTSIVRLDSKFCSLTRGHVVAKQDNLPVIYSKIAASVILSRRDSRLSRRDSPLARRDSRLERNETRLVTYF